MRLLGRFRFGLKALLVAVALLCWVLALVSQPIVEEMRQRQLLREATALGARTTDNLATILRDPSLGRYLLSLFSTSYDRTTLVGLDFSGTKVKDADLALLPKIRYVKELNLSNTQITDAGLAHLAKLEYLTKLDLSGTKVTDQGMTHLGGLDILASLRVAGTSVSHAALEPLDVKLPYAHFREEKAVEELKAAGIQVVGSVRHFEGDMARGCWMIHGGTEAVHIIVGMNRKLTVTRQDVENLSYLPSVYEVTFHTVTLGPQGLAGWQPLEKLRTLEFWFINLSDNDLATIGRQTQLETLAIYDADAITDTGLQQLKSLGKLKKLRISSCGGVSQEAVSALEQALPECRVEFSTY